MTAEVQERDASQLVMTRPPDVHKIMNGKMFMIVFIASPWTMFTLEAHTGLVALGQLALVAQSWLWQRSEISQSLWAFGTNGNPCLGLCGQSFSPLSVLLRCEVFLVITKQTPRRHIFIFSLDMGRWRGVGGGLGLAPQRAALERMGGEPISS